MILDGKLVRKEILNEIKEKVAKNNMDITLAIIFVGSYAPSEVYVRNKIKYCAQVGIKTKLIRLEKSTEEEIINIVEDLNKDNSVHGIIVQSPVPDNINIENVIKHIDSKKDIDGFTKESFYELGHNIDGLRPCTSKGIIRLLKYYNIDLKGKKVCLIGRGNLVGKPLIFEMLNNDATVAICHTKTSNLKEVTLASDIIICGAGCPHLLTSDMVKDGAVVVDAGITVVDSQIVGDADFDNLVNKCSYITPNPGGVGPMTIAMILENVVEAYERMGGMK